MDLLVEDLKCLERPEEISIWGDSDSLGLQQNLQLFFKRCSNETNTVVCKSEQEIDEWLYGKYIIWIINDIKFLKHKFGEGAILKESQLQWQILTPRIPTEFIVTVDRTLMKLNDNILGIDFLFREE